MALKLIIAALLALGLASCSKEESTTPAGDAATQAGEQAGEAADAAKDAAEEAGDKK